MRQIPDDNLCYPVLLTIGASTGSGFFINTGSRILLITAKHVFYNQQTELLHAAQAKITSYPKEQADTEKNIFVLDLPVLSSAGQIKFDSALDIAAIQIATVNPSEPNHVTYSLGVTAEQIARTGIVTVAQDSIRLFINVLVSNDVFIMGYPISLGIKNVPQIDYSKPLIRAGVVAGKNNTRKSIILDCPVYPGNSGGPVIEVEQDGFEYKFRLIGVVIEYVPAIVQSISPGTAGIVINSGYSVAASMDGVLALAHQF